eukprot:GDKJ01041545.1.p1 GENE.GDKJ01041545.1~~GDKJ01041545.1.p1  ORF type:complete len:841 (-),score=161.83 GDKJ01041545.1:276-2798(-)
MYKAFLYLFSVFVAINSKKLPGSMISEHETSSSYRYRDFDEIKAIMWSKGLPASFSAFLENIQVTFDHYYDFTSHQFSLLQKVREVNKELTPSTKKSIESLKKYDLDRSLEMEKHETHRKLIEENIKRRRLQTNIFSKPGTHGCPDLPLDLNLNRAREVMITEIACYKKSSNYFEVVSYEFFENLIKARGVDDVLSVCEVYEKPQVPVCACAPDRGGPSCEKAAPRMCSVERIAPFPDCQQPPDDMVGFTHVPICYNFKSDAHGIVKIDFEFKVECRWAFDQRTGDRLSSMVDDIPYTIFPDTIGKRIHDKEDLFAGFVASGSNERFPINQASLFPFKLQPKGYIGGYSHLDIFPTTKFRASKIVNAYRKAAGIDLTLMSKDFDVFTASGFRNRTEEMTVASLTANSLERNLLDAGVNLDDPQPLPNKRCDVGNGGCVQEAFCDDPGFPQVVTCQCPPSAPFGDGLLFSTGCSDVPVNSPNSEPRLVLPSASLVLGELGNSIEDVLTEWQVPAFNFIQNEGEKQPNSKMDILVPDNIMTESDDLLRLVPVVCPVNFNRLMGQLEDCVMMQGTSNKKSSSEGELVGQNWELSVEQLNGLEPVRLQFKMSLSDLKSKGFIVSGRLQLESFLLPLHLINDAYVALRSSPFGSIVKSSTTSNEVNRIFHIFGGSSSFTRQERLTVVEVLFKHPAAFQFADSITVDLPQTTDFAAKSPADLYEYRGPEYAGDGKLRGAALAGVIVGAVLVALLMTGGVWWWKGRRDKSDEESSQERVVDRGLDDAAMKRRREEAEQEEKKKTVQRDRELLDLREMRFVEDEEDEQPIKEQMRKRTTSSILQTKMN